MPLFLLSLILKQTTMTTFERQIELSHIFTNNNNNFHSYIEECRDNNSIMDLKKFQVLSSAVESSRKELEKFIEENQPR